MVSMRYGLIGFPLSHSFSKVYFTDKFESLGLHGNTYDLIPLPNESMIMQTLRQDYVGLNVTIPYKRSAVHYLNDIDQAALMIGAVNTLVKTGACSWKGYNTDAMAFKDSLLAWLGSNPLPGKALILGTGGSSGAVAYILDLLGMSYLKVSRGRQGDLTYAELDRKIMTTCTLIVNTTPVGMFPDTEQAPELPYELITSRHWMYDLIYNPANSLFLRRGGQMGAKTKNGLQMLHMQAEYAWSIWQSYGK